MYRNYIEHMSNTYRCRLQRELGKNDLNPHNKWYISTLAGTGEQGAKDGSDKTATFNLPTGVTVDGEGNLYIADGSNFQVQKITIKFT